MNHNNGHSEQSMESSNASSYAGNVPLNESVTKPSAEGRERNDYDDDNRNQMFLSLESDFDSLFDCNWMDAQNNVNNINQNNSMTTAGNSVPENCETGMETRQSILTNNATYTHDQQQGTTFYQGSSDNTAGNGSLTNSVNHLQYSSNPSNFGSPLMPHQNSSALSNSTAPTFSQTMHAMPFTYNVDQPPQGDSNGAMWTHHNAPAVQSLAFNAMAGGVTMPHQTLQKHSSNFFVAPNPMPHPSPPLQSFDDGQQPRGSSSSSSPSSLPPFLLFDAPIELRANFIASQRAHGLPTLEDNNMLHYQQTRPPLKGNGSTLALRLIDGRHGDVAVQNRVKNEREQKRTQKISDLIDLLREKMSDGGWKLGGAKSKYATLSTCAEYVKHLVQANKEKELALEKTKNDLDAKRRKAQDDAIAQIDPSDPESTTSSITVSLGFSGEANGATTSSSTQDDPSASCHKKRKARSHDNGGERRNDRSSRSRASPYDDADDERSLDNENETATRKRKSGLLQASKDEATSMDNEFELDYEEVFLKSNVPQLLASMSGRIISWNDFFLKATGLHDSDMERLTIFSLVRQSELSRLFEIVATALRSGSMAATDGDDGAETAPEQQADDVNDEEKSHVSDITTTGKWNYTAITLPCATFRPRTTTDGLQLVDQPLYMTVTLMSDDDPRKRCFHCVFTDCPGTNGALGSVTPELLSLLFTQQDGPTTVDLGERTSSVITVAGN
jgi:PAS domain-containing protein